MEVTTVEQLEEQCRQLRERHPGLKIHVICWGDKTNMTVELTYGPDDGYESDFALLCVPG